MSHTYFISDRAWRLLAKICEANNTVLKRDLDTQQPDGTFRIDLDDDFNDRMQRALKPGESMSDCIVRNLAWMEGEAN